MPRAVSFTKAAVTRAVGGVIDAGFPKERIIGVHVSKDGGIKVLLGDPREPRGDDPENEWDEVLR